MGPRLSNTVHNCGLIYYFLICTIIGTYPSAAMEVYAPADQFVENGNTAILSCLFKSTEVISSHASVTWSFISEESADSSSLSFFYYSNGNAFPGNTQFKSRVQWAGDLNKKDASIRILEIQAKDSGTYFCDVKNPPDIISKPAQTKLRVQVRQTFCQAV